MPSNYDLTNLLGILKRLYLRIMALQTDSRTRVNINSRHSSSANNITGPLSDCIDKLASKSANNPSGLNEIHTHEIHLTAHTHTTISRDRDARTELGELSVHLKDSHKYTGVSQDTGARLMQSTWEHFHTSIRLARQGDTKAAFVHMDLTNKALLEAEHYLPEQEYARFSEEIIQAIEEITNQA